MMTWAVSVWCLPLRTVRKDNLLKPVTRPKCTCKLYNVLIIITTSEKGRGLVIMIGNDRRPWIITLLIEH